MARFLALYGAPVGAMDAAMQNTSQEERDASMEAWNKWMQAKGSAIVSMGAPVGKNKRVSESGVEDVRNEVGGYSIVEADTHEEAAELFTDNPMLEMKGAYVDVLAIMPMPGG